MCFGLVDGDALSWITFGGAHSRGEEFDDVNDENIPNDLCILNGFRLVVLFSEANIVISPWKFTPLTLKIVEQMNVEIRHCYFYANWRAAAIWRFFASAAQAIS